MKPEKSTKLSINKLTIASLNNANLGRVMGGNTVADTNCYITMKCSVKPLTCGVTLPCITPDSDWSYCSCS
jgi:hypothetical protein